MKQQKFYIVRKQWRDGKEEGCCVVGDAGYVSQEKAREVMRMEFESAVDRWAERIGDKDIRTMTLFMNQRNIWHASSPRRYCYWWVDEITVNE